MPQTQHNINLAHSLWVSGDALEVGRLLFEELSAFETVQWAIAILRTVYKHCDNRNETILELLSLADSPSEWHRAKSIFNRIRDELLAVEEVVGEEECHTSTYDPLLIMLYVAENAAKVMYNATNPTDPFDEDSGWWLAQCLMQYLDCVKQPKLAEEAWASLTSLRT